MSAKPAKKPNPDGRVLRRMIASRFVCVGPLTWDPVRRKLKPYRRRPEGERKLTRAEKKAAKRSRRS